MQDKNIHIDKKFTDQAWKKMKSILDHELPVSSDDKKRPLAFWISSAIGLAALFVGVYFIAHLDNLNTLDANKKEFFTEETNNNNSLLKDNYVLQTEDKSLAQSNELNETNPSIKNNNKIGISELKTTRFQQSNSTTFNKPIINKKTESTNIKTNHSTINSNPIKNSGITENTGSGTEIIFNKDTIQINNYSNKYKVDKIQSRVIEKLEFQPQINPIYLSKEKQKKIRHIAFASTMFIPGSKSNGLNIGYLQNIKTGKEGVSIQTGLSYNYLSQPIEYTFAETSSNGGQTGSPQRLDVLYDISYSGSNNSQFLDSSGSLEDYNPSSPNDIPINKLKLHYLSIPVQLILKKGRLEVSGGIQGGILLLASNNSFDGGVLNIAGSNKNEDLFYANTVSATSSDLPNPKISNLDLSGTLGIGFRLSENVGLHLNYIHGFKDVIKQNSKKDFNRLLQISMQYGW